MQRSITRYAVLILVYCACVTTAGAAEKYKLIIDYGDGSQKHFTGLPWSEGLTVLEATKIAEKHPRGIKVQTRGSKSTAFLEQIDEVANEGGGGRNWVFRVNDELGDRSCGIYELKASDTILWRFQKYE